MDQKHFITGNLARLDQLSTLLGREEIDYIKLIKDFPADTVDAADTLDDAHRIPGDIIVNDEPSAIQVKAFRDLVGTKQDIKIIVLLRIRGVKILVYL